MKRLRRILLLMLLVLFIPIVNVNAAKEKQVTVEDPLYYYTDTTNPKYGSFYGLSKDGSKATKYTKYKHINNNPAYCVQSEDLAPKNGATYIEVGIDEAIGNKTWTKDDMWISGFIINLIDKDFSGEKEKEYVMTYAALNSQLTGIVGGRDFSVYNPTVKSYVTKAKEQYKKYYTTTLPGFNVTANTNNVPNNKVLTRNKSGNNVTYTGSFKLTNLIASFGESHIVYDTTDKVTYTVKPNSTKVKLCKEKTCSSPQSVLTYSNTSNDVEIFLKATNVTDADDITIVVTATNESYYNNGRLWRPKSGNSQILLGLGYDESIGHLTRKTVKKINFTLPDPDPIKKTITLKKFDATTGALLSGANLKLELSGVGKSCETKGATNCKIEVTENDISTIKYSVTELSVPKGYKLGSQLGPLDWMIKANSEVCYVDINGATTATELVDCDRNYQVAPVVCKVDNSYVFEKCKTEKDLTGLNCDSETGVCTSIETGEVVETIPDKVIGEESVNICYYENNGTKNIVDSNKCGHQYMKVTNSGNNLVVEYYNEKTRVVISKVGITGNEEVSGATLKICDGKPDSTGKCNVVRNVLEGQCSNSGIFGDVNCKNINNDTKEVDMQWVSGSIPKIWYGLETEKTYYIVETIAPNGYKPITTAVEFKIEKNGTIVSKSYNKELDKIVIENAPTKFSVVKKDKKKWKSIVRSKFRYLYYL